MYQLLGLPCRAVKSHCTTVSLTVNDRISLSHCYTRINDQMSVALGNLTNNEINHGLSGFQENIIFSTLKFPIVSVDPKGGKMDATKVHQAKVDGHGGYHYHVSLSLKFQLDSRASGPEQMISFCEHLLLSSFAEAVRTSSCCRVGMQPFSQDFIYAWTQA